MAAAPLSLWLPFPQKHLYHRRRLHLSSVDIEKAQLGLIFLTAFSFRYCHRQGHALAGYFGMHLSPALTITKGHWHQSDTSFFKR